LAHAPQQIFGQLRGARLGLTHHTLRTAREGAVCRQRIETRTGRREDEPAGTHAPSADALAVDRVSDVRESLCKVDNTFGKPMDVCHLFQPLCRNFDCVPSVPTREALKRPCSRLGVFRGEEDPGHLLLRRVAIEDEHVGERRKNGRERD
jgi:hypothetical protein